MEVLFGILVFYFIISSLNKKISECDDDIDEDPYGWNADPYECFNENENEIDEYSSPCDGCSKIVKLDDMWYSEDGELAYCGDCASDKGFENLVPPGFSD
jgi:hypothetical protein